MATIGNLIVNIGAKIDGLRKGLKDSEGLIQGAKAKFDGLGKAVGTGLKVAAGIGVAGLLTFGAGAIGAASSGLAFNNSLEQTTARINAFTKDGAATADILAMIQTRAAATPFEFEQMSAAAAALLPSAKQAGTGLEELIEKAEILAASNPAEGLEGAAFALKEAVSGDFTSIIERFNLPRSYINKLKDEGVPALEIVQRAMGELGLDTSLVTNLAATAEGRWSTLKDTFTNLAATVTKPIFNLFSSSLAKVNDYLSANQGWLQAVADTVAGELSTAITTGLGIAIEWITGTGLPALQQFGAWFMTTGWPAIQQFGGLILSQLVPGLIQLGMWGMQIASAVLPLLSAAIQFVIDHFNIFGPILAVIGIAILALTSPVTLIIAAIVLLATAWANNWWNIQGITQGVVSWIQANVVPVIAAIIAFVAANWPLVQQTIQSVMAAVQQVIGTVLEYIRSWWQQHGDSVLAIALFLYNAIKTNIEQTLAVIWAIIQTVLGLVKAFWNRWGNELLTIARANWDNIKVIVDTAMNLIGFIIDAVAALIRGDWQAFGEALENIWRTIWDGIRAILENAKTALAATLTILVGLLKPVWEGFVEWLKNIWDSAWEWIKSKVEGASSAVSGAVSALINSVKSIWESGIGTLKSKWDDIWNAIRRKVEDIAGPIQDTISGIVGWINDAIGALNSLIGLQGQAGSGAGASGASVMGANKGAGAASGLGGSTGGKTTQINLYYYGSAPGDPVRDLAMLQALAVT